MTDATPPDELESNEPELDKPPLEPVDRLSRDLVRAMTDIGVDEARYLVDSYYQIQDYRKASNSQNRSLDAQAEPHLVVGWLATQMEALEGQLRRALGQWASEQPAGAWAQSIVGIGPVLSAGLLAHIDIAKAPTVGHIWRFAGLDPTSRWEKGQKRPWNAALKVLCWKIGESFVKVSGNPNDVYGKVYLARKEREIRLNEAFAFREQAERKLATVRIGKDTDAYKAYSLGKLPPAHIHARAERYATKLFLSHYHHVAYEVANGVPPPKPYILEHPEVDQTGASHIHFVGPPNWPMK